MLTAREAAEYLGVSPRTLRRDCATKGRKGRNRPLGGAGAGQRSAGGARALGWYGRMRPERS